MSDPLGNRMWRVETADNLTYLPTLPENSIDAVVCDPPYGLSKEPDIAEVLACWLAGKPYTHAHRGFMGREWDSFVPGPETWREVFRVLKPGGHLVCFAGTRTHDLMSIALRLAGFEFRDTISAFGLQWLHGTGFPKGLDISKAIDKMAGAEREVVGRSTRCIGPAQENGFQGSATFRETGWEDGNVVTAPATEDAKRWDGWNVALKPAVEPILLCRKPLSEHNVAANVLRWGTGGLNVDACRIGIESTQRPTGGHSFGKDSGWNPHNLANVIGGSTIGRWPPNAVFIHSPGCEQIGERKVRGDNRQGGGIRPGHFYDIGSQPGSGGLVSACYGDTDGTETVAEYACVDGCPVAELDRQSGNQRSGTAVQRNRDGGVHNVVFGAYRKLAQDDVTFGDFGGASRYFPTFRYEAKADTVERNIGMPLGERNLHPTCKPVALMQWLVRLVTPPGGICLDPFCGSGTTGMAALREGFRFLGIEKDPEYAAIACLRIEGDAPLLNAPPEPTPASVEMVPELTLFDGVDE